MHSRPRVAVAEILNIFSNVFRLARIFCLKGQKSVPEVF